MDDLVGATILWRERRGHILKALPHVDNMHPWFLVHLIQLGEQRWINSSEADIIDRETRHIPTRCDVAPLLEQPVSIRYLNYEFFESIRTAFPAYLHRPNPANFAYSLHVCPRCIAPFPSLHDLEAHEAFCQRLPNDVPGILIYHDSLRGIQIRFVDGAQHVQFSRNLAVLGAAFVDKDLSVDVDVTEFFVLVAPLSYFAEQRSGSRRNVVVGYFARYKQQPQHSLSVFFVFPFARKCGFGDLLLSVAFHLSDFRALFCGKEFCCGSGPGKIDEPFSEMGREAIYRFFSKRLLRRGLPNSDTAFSNGAELIKTHLGVHPVDGFRFLMHIGALHSAGRTNKMFFVAIDEGRLKALAGPHTSLFNPDFFLPSLSITCFHYS